MKAAGLHELVDINYKAISEYKIIWTLKTKFQSLVDHGLWIHSEGNKLDMEVDLECNYQQGFMKKTLWLLIDIHKEDVICLNSETSVFVYSRGSSTVKTVGQGKLYVYVGKRTSEKTICAVRARM